MKFIPTNLNDAVLIELERRSDERGFFARSFCVEEFAEAGLPTDFVQQNTSGSVKSGTLRGLHMQLEPDSEDKLMSCIAGSIFDVIVDLRPQSATFLQWQGFELSAKNARQLFVPKGFAHGYLTLAPNTEVRYLVSHRYTPSAEVGLRWNDPAFNIEWPIEPVVVSQKDQNWPDFNADSFYSSN